MLEKLDVLPWDRIRHIYGPATDLPDVLRKHRRRYIPREGLLGVL